MDLLSYAINKEYKQKRVRSKENIKKMKAEQNEFLAKCESLAESFIPILVGTDSNKPLDKAYLIFESIV